MKQVTEYVAKKEQLAFAIKPFVRYGTKHEVKKNRSGEYALFGNAPESKQGELI